MAPLFVLTETSAGYALLKAKDKKILKRDDLSSTFGSVEGTCEELKLKNFLKYENAATALSETSSLLEGKVTPLLTSFLEPLKDEKKATLAVADPKLGNAIGRLSDLSISAVSDSTTNQIFRAIREYRASLIPSLSEKEDHTMSLGLSHSLSRHKLQFSPEKVDVMVIQAVSLLDDIDKELNQYAMRVKEWYGWHFPEMAKIINDNYAYARVVCKMGVRRHVESTDLSDILPEEIEAALKSAAETSMGIDMTDEDFEEIRGLADEVVEMTQWRQNLSNFLASRMEALAPSVYHMVGPIVGARLVGHAGSLVKLAMSPASTIQVLGAEKALFRALKTKHDTPKYGILYSASMVGQANGKNKGKIARMLAAKLALGVRIDALSDWGVAGERKKPEPTDDEKFQYAKDARRYLEGRLSKMEGKPMRPQGAAVAPAQQPGKWSVKEARRYNPDADGLTGDEPAADAVETNGTTPQKLVQEESSSEASSDEEAAPKGGKDSKESKKAIKAAEKEAKKAKKAEKERKKEEKAAKKGDKEEKKDKKDKKKRKSEGGEEESKKSTMEALSDKQKDEDSKKENKKRKRAELEEKHGSKKSKA